MKKKNTTPVLIHTLSTRIDEDRLKRLAKLAQEIRRDHSFIVRDAIDEYLNKRNY